MHSDDYRRRWVREYLETGEQPKSGYVLSTMAHQQRTFVIAKDSDGSITWAFSIGKTGHLYALGQAYLFALENEEAKRR